jgi:hypothetical protein
MRFRTLTTAYALTAALSTTTACRDEAPTDTTVNRPIGQVNSTGEAQPELRPGADPPGHGSPPGGDESADDETSWRLLDERGRRALQRSPVPALVPSADALLAAATLMSGPHWFALSTRDDGLVVSLHATDHAHRYRHIAPHRGASRVRGHDALVTQNERIWSAAWIEHGAAYVLELECARAADARCDDPAALLAVAEQLVSMAPPSVQEGER